jgi:Tol biopolymer transport system component
MVWVDRKGAEQPLPAPPHAYANPRLSPDGRQVALDITEASRDIWTYDLTRDTLTRLTFEGINQLPVWTPDGKRIVYRSGKSGGGGANLFWKLADGSGAEERLTTSQYVQTPSSFSPDGKTLAYMEQISGYDLWTVSVEGERKPQSLLKTSFDERGAWLSPDGHWAAYASNESGRFEVYVQPFPGPGGKRQISTEGGTEPRWSSKGNELFYRTGAQREKMMAVDIQTQPTFTAGKPRFLFEGPYASNIPGGGLSPDYSTSRDDQRFLMLKPKEQQQTQALAQINVVQNWFEELKRRVPTGRK